MCLLTEDDNRPPPPGQPGSLLSRSRKPRPLPRKTFNLRSNPPARAFETTCATVSNAEPQAALRVLLLH
ncbi:hypothetical protein CC2G_013548 [Coprinopsis cinerea AmutBmut pab1-1]|nr:hypothetical protein CC2G_013548 [Coprinopsis cinerea AmutBmut pab1-1]